MSNKVTDDYPGKGISTEQLKSDLMQEHQVQTVEKSKFPTEIVDLPSKGLLYPKDNPLSSGKVEMKYMTAKEEDILTSQNLIQKGVVIDMLLRSLLVSNGEGQRVSYDDLVIGDKNAIMVAARVLGYGAEYPAEMQCPACGTKHKVDINLTEFDAVEFDENAVNSDGNFTFALPVSKRELTFKLLTHADEKKVEEISKRKKKKTIGGGGITYDLTSRLKAMIVAIDGDETRKVIDDFVDNQFLSRDSLAFRKYLEGVSPDIDMSIPFDCENCGHEAKVPMPMNVNFFWPGA